MKFSNYLTKIAGVDIYPLISLILFVTFFIIVTLWIFSKSKSEIDYQEKIPFND